METHFSLPHIVFAPARLWKISSSRWLNSNRGVTPAQPESQDCGSTLYRGTAQGCPLDRKSRTNLFWPTRIFKKKTVERIARHSPGNLRNRGKLRNPGSPFRPTPLSESVPAQTMTGICSQQKILRRKSNRFFTTTLWKPMQDQLRIRNNTAFLQLERERAYQFLDWNSYEHEGLVNMRCLSHLRTYCNPFLLTQIGSQHIRSRHLFTEKDPAQEILQQVFHDHIVKADPRSAAYPQQYCFPAAREGTRVSVSWLSGSKKVKSLAMSYHLPSARAYASLTRVGFLLTRSKFSKALREALTRPYATEGFAYAKHDMTRPLLKM